MNIEPFRIKAVEPIRFTTREERERALETAGHNVFLLRAEDVMIDLLTDSGTGAMSAAQWGALMQGDESYAGSRSFFHFRDVVHELTGYKHIIPAHQGRAAERILFHSVLKPGDIVLNNIHFDTTRANIEVEAAEARDLVIAEGWRPDVVLPFKGNMQLDALEETLRSAGNRVRMVMLTVTNNSGGGQPVSLENIRAVSKICKKFGKLFSSTRADSPRTRGSSSCASQGSSSAHRRRSPRRCSRSPTAARSRRRKTDCQTSAAFWR